MHCWCADPTASRRDLRLCVRVRPLRRWAQRHRRRRRQRRYLARAQAAHPAGLHATVCVQQSAKGRARITHLFVVGVVNSLGSTMNKSVCVCVRARTMAACGWLSPNGNTTPPTHMTTSAQRQRSRLATRARRRARARREARPAKREPSALECAPPPTPLQPPTTHDESACCKAAAAVVVIGAATQLQRRAGQQERSMHLSQTRGGCAEIEPRDTHKLACSLASALVDERVRARACVCTRDTIANTPPVDARRG